MNSLARFLLYTLSLPERAVRGTVGLAAGGLREASELLVPKAFQDARTYQIMVRNSLQFLVTQVGGIQTAPAAGAADPTGDADYLARKAVGNFVDLAGLMTFQLSPVWLLAVASDVAYGGKAFLRELADELRRKGLIAADSTIDSTNDVLDALQQGAGRAAQMFDTPPLSVDQLRDSLRTTREAVQRAEFTRLLPRAEMERFWQQMRTIASRDGVGLMEVSGALTMHALTSAGQVAQGAATGARVGLELLDRHVIGHYQDALQRLVDKGVYATVRDCWEPYLSGVWRSFGRPGTTVTEDVVSGQLPARLWRRLRDWWRRPPKCEQP